MAVFTRSLCCQSDWILSGEFRLSHFWCDQIDSWHSHMSPHTIIPGNPPVFRLLARLNLLGFFVVSFLAINPMRSDQTKNKGTGPLSDQLKIQMDLYKWIQADHLRPPLLPPRGNVKYFTPEESRVANIFDGALTQRQHLCEGVLQMSLGYFQEVRQVQKTSAN